MSPDLASTGPTLLPPSSGVTVRMYRPGLGDCFLLAFRAVDGTARYMLIDCGVLIGTKGGADKLRKIAKDISAATGNRLHALVATHEHWDQTSGFQYAQKTFEEMSVDEVWMAWTENPEDEMASRLREKRALALEAIGAAVHRLKAASSPEAERIESVLDFYGGFGIDGKINTTAEQWEFLHEMGSPPRYCRPGESPIALPDVEAVRIYVLGPPEDERLLSKSNPSKSDSEVYERAVALGEESAFYLAALGAEDPDALSLDQWELERRSRPFDRNHIIQADEAESHDEHGEFFRERYGFGGTEDDHGVEWRRINTEWLAAAGRLALNLDNDTNNTSLTLAIELVESGKVLLFVADAQVGNWLSWHDLSWPAEGGEDCTVTGGDLIRRTVLYKVGHHGSHNATLREMGLEMMESQDLVAMIPVDREKAENKKWSMPFPPLEERLNVKAKGRVIRADSCVPGKPDSISDGDWAAFLAVTEDSGPDGLWVQYTILG